MPPAAATAAKPLPKPIQGFQPSTFLERGICVPFTTPALVGARLRPGERRGTELIVANLSGEEGVYVLPLDGIYGLCSPTLHDRRLTESLALLPNISPAAVRQAARDVAAEGLAGREAAAAAQAAIAQADQEALYANFELVMEMLRQIEPRGPDWALPETCDPATLEARARRALATLAPRIGRPADALMTMLEELSGVFHPVGIGRQAEAARLPVLAGRVEALRRDMIAFQRCCDDGRDPDAALVEATADLTARIARAKLKEARDLLADLPGLLPRWLNEPDTIAAIAARPEWLLDGWERICLLWRGVDAVFTQEMALREMAGLIPTTPREASDWADISVEITAMRGRRKINLGQDWRTGVTTADVVARNERMCAQSLAPGAPA